MSLQRLKVISESTKIFSENDFLTSGQQYESGLEAILKVFLNVLAVTMQLNCTKMAVSLKQDASEYLELK